LQTQSVRTNGDKNIIEVRLTANNSTNFLAQAYDATTNDTIINVIPVHLASVGVATQDIKVTLTLDNTIIDNYNTANDKSLEAAPVDIYTVQNAGVVTIPAGARDGILQIKLKPADFIGHEYAFGFRITAIDKPGYIISGNLQTGLYAVAIKNQYDGAYTLKGRHTRPTLDYPYNTVIHMVTTGQNSVAFYWPDVSSFGHPIGVGPNNALSWYGAGVAPNVTFDPGTNFVTNVENSAGAPPISIYAGAGSGQGRFDPVTKDMFVYFRYNANDARGFLDTLTYIGPR
jgi:hypothetical protein